MFDVYKMERPIETGDFVKVSIGEDIQTYIIQNIEPERIHIALVSDVDQKKVLVSTPEEWKVSGIPEKHDIEFFSKESLPQLFFTKTPEIDTEILVNLDDKTLSLICQVDRYAKSLCDSQELWEKRLEKYYPFEYSLAQMDITGIPTVNYKELYMDTATYPIHMLKKYTDATGPRFPENTGFYSSRAKVYEAIIEDLGEEGLIKRDTEGNITKILSDEIKTYKQFLIGLSDIAEIKIGGNTYEYSRYGKDKPIRDMDPY